MKGKALTVLPFAASHLQTLVLQPAQAPFRSELYPETLQALEATREAWSLFSGHRIIGCGGVQDLGGGRGLAWTLLARDTGAAMVTATKVVRRYLQTTPYRRIEAVTACNFAPAARWVRLLGFSPEGRMRAYCQDGGDAERWAIINPHQTGDRTWPGSDQP